MKAKQFKTAKKLTHVCYWMESDKITGQPTQHWSDFTSERAARRHAKKVWHCNPSVDLISKTTWHPMYAKINAEMITFIFVSTGKTRLSQGFQE